MTTFAENFPSFGKGCRIIIIIRGAELLEEVWYALSHYLAETL